MTRLVLVSAVILSCAAPAAACPFCTAVQPSLSERRADAAVALVAEAVRSDDDRRHFTVQKILAGADALADPKQLALGTSDITDGASIKPGQLALALATRRGAAAKLSWEIVPLDEVGYAYVMRSPAPRSPPAERLAYYARYLEHANALVAEDAYREFGNAPYDVVALVADRLPYAAMRRWIVDPRIPEAHKGFYGLALGLATSDADRRANEQVLRQLIDASADDFRAGFDGVLGGYLVLEGSAGLQRIDERLLSNDKARSGDLRHAMTALRFIHEFGRGAIPARELNRAMRKLLRRPELAAPAIVDLARWQDWDALAEIVPLFDRAGYIDPATTRAIVGYLSACPRPEAAETLARLRRQSPQRIAEAERDSLLPPASQ